MPQICLAWLGRRHRLFHRELVAGRFPFHPLCISRCASVALVSQSMFYAAGHSGKIPGMPSVSIAGASVAPVSQSIFCAVGGSRKIPGMSSVSIAGLTSTLIFRASFSTNAAEIAECKDNSSEATFEVKIGDANELSQRILAQVNHMNSKVRNFQKRYEELVRPRLISRCLIAPNDLSHPSTIFLHRQTFKICNHHATYVSCFDIMGLEAGIRDEELEILLRHMVEKNIYVIEAWDSTISTIEVLVYDHGVKGPQDGTEVEFYKGECDAAFNGVNTATLSFIIWKGNSIVYSEVYKGVTCESATKGEAFAAFALLYKASELKIQKLLLCCDSKSVCKVLSGELGIGLNHAQRNLYLMLRSMKRHFNKLVIMWKPRELMVFADDLAKASDNSLAAPSFPKAALKRWSNLLRGLPLYRIERTEETNKKIRKFGKTQLDEAYGVNNDSIFFIEVGDELKYDCLLGLQQSFDPAAMTIFINDFNDKPDAIQKEFEKFVDISCETKIGRCSMFNGEFKDAFTQKHLVVVFDDTIPKDVYHIEDVFHVILVSPDHRTSMTELKIPELTALAFIYFKGVKLPLNDSTS